jgi:transposase
MNIVYERCAGLDVHKKTVVVCAISADTHGQRSKEWRTFSTMTPDLLRMRHWLKAVGVTHVAMESTGIYWKPIFNVLEGHLEVLLVNAQHLKAVPGRKTDVKDAEWIADLLQHGLLRPSFVPPGWQREVRDLTRYRTSLIEERSRAINRLQKSAPRRQHQAGLGGHGSDGQIRPRYARSHPRRRSRSHGPGRARTWEDAGQT